MEILIKSMERPAGRARQGRVGPDLDKRDAAAQGRGQAQESRLQQDPGRVLTDSIRNVNGRHQRKEISIKPREGFLESPARR